MMKDISSFLQLQLDPCYHFGANLFHLASIRLMTASPNGAGANFRAHADRLAQEIGVPGSGKA
jgi:hypothetical protein